MINDENMPIEIPSSILSMDMSRITGESGLKLIEHKYRIFPENEYLPIARNTSYLELVTVVVPDKKQNFQRSWVTPLYVFHGFHLASVGLRTLCKKTHEFLELESMKHPMDILSISAGMYGEYLYLYGMIRCYDSYPDMNTLYEFIGEDRSVKKAAPVDHLVIPPDVIRVYTEEEQAAHKVAIDLQRQAYDSSTPDAPFLNQLESYTPAVLPEMDDSVELSYDLVTKDMQTETILPYERFIGVFKRCMQYVTSVERDHYYNVMRGKVPKGSFFSVVEAYIRQYYIDTHQLSEEDLPALLSKMDRALFQLYIVQDLIDDPLITDVKITAPDSIRVRVKGKAYLSNITFIDREDYLRFVQGIAVKNNIDLDIPSQTFTDESDPNYILRFSLTSPYITGSGYPFVHIRKVSRKKLLGDDLIKAGMMDKKVRDYLLDCGRHSRGVVFAGPPGSGKTVALNWFLEEAYESSAEILVIQDSDELFCYRHGVMIEHVVNNPARGEARCTLEDLGQMALVAGCNVFVIGEAKGAEICSAITLSNSGCRTAITIHSPSSTETIDKMADLAMRGYATSFEQAKRMIKSFQTIVYLQDFKIQEISEIIGYNEKRKDMDYRMIYRRPED